MSCKFLVHVRSTLNCRLPLPSRCTSRDLSLVSSQTKRSRACGLTTADVGKQQEPVDARGTLQKRNSLVRSAQFPAVACHVGVCSAQFKTRLRLCSLLPRGASLPLSHNQPALWANGGSCPNVSIDCTIAISKFIPYGSCQRRSLAALCGEVGTARSGGRKWWRATCAMAIDAPTGLARNFAARAKSNTGGF